MSMATETTGEYFDYDAFIAAVDGDKGSKSAIASDLQISRNSLYKLLNRESTPERATSVRLRVRYGTDFWRSV